MPLSEFHQAMTKGKPESNQSKMTNWPSDVSSVMLDNEFVELLWENGQIVLQGQSSRPKKSAFPTIIPSHYARVQEKEGGSPKAGRCSAMDPMLNNDLSPAVPTAHVGMNAQDDDLVPWMNYPMEDPLQNDYCSEFFSEFPGLNLSSLLTHNNATPTDRSSGLGLGRDSHNVEHGHPIKPMTGGGQEASRVKTSQFFQLSQQSHNNRLRPSELGAGNSIRAHQGPSGDQLDIRLQKQDIMTPKLLQPNSSMGLMNFSHFSRPVALVKANLQSVDRLRSNEKASTATSSNPIESTLVYTTSGLKSVSGVQGKLASLHPRLDLRPSVKPPEEVASVTQSEAVCLEDAPRHGNNEIANTGGRPPDDNNHPSSSFAVSMAIGRHGTEKGPEAVVASSVCSGNSAGPASNDPKQRAKRKTHEGDESGYQTEDLEDDSVIVKKPATGRGTSTKRSRAAEVHNLSERRRRDRINERMRALQELIPNCNKVDKASMLDEAIEYLKTLQLQVQIMSLGSGLCMPPVMLPAGLQHMRAPHMAHFSPMGVGMGMGMGMGMGYGMGMLDMNGSPGCPLIPVPPIHGSQFPCPSIPGAQGLHGMAGSTGLQMFGIPGQALPMSMPRPPPPFGSFMGPSTRPNLVPKVSGTATSSVLAADAAPASSSKDQQQQNTNLDTLQKTSVDDSKIPTSAQAAKECFKKSTVAQMSHQTSHVKGNDAINSSSDPGLSPTGKTCYGQQVIRAG